MCISDWSSDVCSSDLVDRQSAARPVFPARREARLFGPPARPSRERCRGWSRTRAERARPATAGHRACSVGRDLWHRQFYRSRSEERRVGKRVSVRVDLGGRVQIKKKKKQMKEK